MQTLRNLRRFTQDSLRLMLVGSKHSYLWVTFLLLLILAVMGKGVALTATSRKAQSIRPRRLRNHQRRSLARRVKSARSRRRVRVGSRPFYGAPCI